MIRNILLIVSLLSGTMAIGQNNTKKTVAQAGDHVMLQISSDNWMGAPDSISSRIKTLSRGFNAYIMYNKPFKNSLHYSVALGLGISNSNIFFDKYSAEINGTGTALKFNNLENTNRFKKYKIATTFVEIPLELRYSSKADNPSKAVKFALGGKFGLLVNAHTKGKNLLDNTGRTINEYTEKINSRRFFNSTRISATARIGYGNYSLFGSYALTDIFKENTAAKMNLLQIGLSVSGL